MVHDDWKINGENDMLVGRGGEYCIQSYGYIYMYMRAQKCTLSSEQRDYLAAKFSWCFPVLRRF